MLTAIKRLFDPSKKELKRLEELAAEVNRWEPEIEKLSDEALAAKTPEFKNRIAAGETLDDLLPEAFAVAREAARRTIGQRPYDTQLMGGIVLHQGRIAEMKTGEGKTLSATLPVYLNALTGKGVHVVTVNDYLARRDAAWMGNIYRFLGLSVGVIVPGLSFEQRRHAYACDITYGTNNEYGFDYLRDNMVMRPEQMVQRGLHYAIVDEVDSILVDEARTPLIISGQAEESTDRYNRFAKLAQRLQRDEHYTIDEKSRQVAITEEGVAAVEKMLGVDNLYADGNFDDVHHIQQALKAQALFKRDKDYVVKDDEVIIVDEFTGRLMFGRRYSDGLHQAIEAKEGVKIERESQTLASITFQNYFRMYEKISGMTGTAKTEEEEFGNIYGMEVIVIPTHRPMVRDDMADLVFKSTEAKFKAIVNQIAELHAEQRPVLVGTSTIEQSESLSAALKRRGIRHQVLNAKFHEQEAEIVAQAGRLGAVTIATNMAGRGTDIMLGGNPDFLAKEALKKKYSPEVLAVAAEQFPTDDPQILEARSAYQEVFAKLKQETDAEREQVLAKGGLYILGTERHESRRIDNQLRGRAGRQGDVGASRFYVSLQDDLMRIFGSERVTGLMERLGWKDDEPIEHNQISRSIENAQKKVESNHFEMRKQILQFDDVMNKQRELIYRIRRDVLMGDSVSEKVKEMLVNEVEHALDAYCDAKAYPEEWDLEGFVGHFNELTDQALGLSPDNLRGLEREAVRERTQQALTDAYAQREAEIGAERLRELERMVYLTFIDRKWMDHLRAMDDLRDGIGLRAYGQKNPLMEYQFEAHQMFQAMNESIAEDVLKYIFRVQVISEQTSMQKEGESRLQSATFRHGGSDAGGKGDKPQVQQRRVENRVGRNEPCPCGSGKKYKRCCGAA